MDKVFIIPKTIGSDGEILLCEDVQTVEKFHMAPFESITDPDSKGELLVEFICTKFLFPIYLTFEPFTGMGDDLEGLFQGKNI
ncbi:hypothetical protein GPDM_06715 [Planococcus donghaensis MPA1U2]|uniref:Uncharacterized protein n=1 Tax=Planococcus donghaensis MPA1U2 TaxID=933115 RepID=E7RFU5_9BACL|nr:hypothetical protein [Planococcus donghaensis]EGA90215.1 hypothetical protein GPDM_06715 [Planococcus donghaensis MPA1U2]